MAAQHKFVLEGKINIVDIGMSKRNIKKRVFMDSVVEIEPEDEPAPKRRRNASKKKNGYASDDSFQYGGDVRKNKLEKKQEKKKEKEATKAIINNPPPEPEPEPTDRKRLPPTKSQVRTLPEVNTEYVVRFMEPKKPKLDKQRRIFNPEEYYRHLEQKLEYEARLGELYEKFGHVVAKQAEPKSVVTARDHLLKHIQEVGKERWQERQQRVRLAKKVARYAQMTYNRAESLHEQKEKEEERKVRRTASSVWKLVQKDYWRNISRVNRFLDAEQRKKDEKEVQSRRLEQLVERQLEVSNRISQMMEGIDEIKLSGLEVSNVVFPPIIINIETSQMKYIGLEEDKTIRQPLLIKHPLREYQLLGMHWIATLHSRRMNGILADEMGLGKTIQTIAFLAHLALSKGIWGPHLIIVPTSIIINWQIEFKRWCPAFKIMTYFGSPKERKIKRKGWSRLNSFHVCITSYKIVVTDQAIFKRKKWYYMVLDEAQHIKNYKSQRWQTLLNFNARSRLLLTGTPLQNDISQLWSLLHFLMPSLFTSYQDFNQWFNVPFQEALEKNFPISQQILRKLHTVLRPFLLRRLKKDVEKQLPHKTQKVVPCPLSRRQKYLYDEFISHESKKNPEITGMMNILMQLKKVCNHPDLFLPRVEETPFGLPTINLVVPNQVVISLKKVENLYETKKLTISYQQIAELVIDQFEKVKCSKFSFQYYADQYRTRLQFVILNYHRSRKMPFSIHNNVTRGLINKIGTYQAPRVSTVTIEERIRQFEPVFSQFLFCVPKVAARTPRLVLSQFSTAHHSSLQQMESHLPALRQLTAVFHTVESQLLVHFPGKNILLYDSGKLVKMVGLLKLIKQRGEKALIFTQMTRMLDIFEKVLNMNRFNYVRLDGGTKTEMRQQLVERFNNDPRVLCFISSTRSGGIGLNLTGASNVIFYDTDWNPAMDRQAQDRCHRIGQTRNVTIYRLISEHTIEENILMKSIQKRRLDELVTQDGMFNTEYFEKVNIRDMLQGVIGGGAGEALEADLAQVEDNEDREMLRQAEMEGRQNNDFARDEAIHTEMFPKLFQYGLEMIKLSGVQAVDESDEQEQDEDRQDEQADISGAEQPPQQNISAEQIQSPEKLGNSSAKEQPAAVQIERQPEKDNPTNIEEEEDEPNSMKVSDFERYSGIITYQKHYNYIRRNFYESADPKPEQ